jgi:hypothetical protein
VTGVTDALPAIVRSEFAMVELAFVPGASGPLLQVTDASSGRSVRLDALELEGLCWLDCEQRRRLLDPESRWTDA